MRYKSDTALREPKVSFLEFRSESIFNHGRGKEETNVKNPHDESPEEVRRGPDCRRERFEKETSGTITICFSCEVKDGYD